MPKGVSVEREYTCRACGEMFRTTRTGKGVYYCRGPECDERRKREGIRTPNRVPLGQGGTSAAERRAAAERAEARRLERLMNRRHAEALRMDRERDRRLAREARDLERAVRAAHVEALVMDRERDRRIRERQRRAAAVRGKFERARALMEGAVARARERQAAAYALAVELAELEGRPAPAPEPPTRAVPASASSAAQAAREPRRAPHVPTGDLGELLDRVRADVVRRSVEPSGDRRVLLRRAIVGVAHARGVPGMREALHALVVEALAWEYALRGGGRELGQASEDVAA